LGLLSANAAAPIRVSWSSSSERWLQRQGDHQGDLLQRSSRGTPPTPPPRQGRGPHWKTLTSTAEDACLDHEGEGSASHADEV